MTKRRVIPVLTCSDGKLVKTTRFSNPRNLNSFIAAARVYNSRNVDELVLLSIDGTVPVGLFSRIAKECFMPLAMGGGIRTMDDVDSLFRAGADKVVIRTAVDLIPEVARRYGSQAVILAKDFNGTTDAFTYGAGEVLLTSVERDGTMTGYDLETLKRLTGRVDVPIIVNGGCGSPEHCLQAIRAGADAVAASSIFHFTEITPQDINKHLHANGIPVRV